MFAHYIARFRQQMRAAIADRQTLAELGMARLTTIIATLVASYIAVALVLVPSDAAREFNFVDERGAITVLSAIFLAMGSGFAFVSFLLSSNSSQKTRFFWLLMTMAIGFLALDELLEFHERIGHQLDQFDVLGLTSAGYFRNWNDVIVILYGVVALVVGILFLPTVLGYAKFLELVCVAGGFYIIHTAIDSLAEPKTTMSVILEESAKLFCSTFIALAFLAGLLLVVRKISLPVKAAGLDPPRERSFPWLDA